MSNTPTCLCTDAVFWNEPCPAHPKPQADKTIDELERDIAIEVGIVYKHSKLGTDYTVNCTNVILSLCEHYSEALAAEARKDELRRADQNAHKIKDYFKQRLRMIEIDESAIKLRNMETQLKENK